MRPYYFDFDAPRTRRATAIVAFERTMRGGLRPPRQPRRFGEILHAAATLVRLWHRRIRGRGALARLDARMLRDIGVTPSEAAGEINKPFWRA